MKIQHIIAASVMGLALLGGGCNESPRNVTALDPGAITPELRAAAGLKDDVEIVGAEQHDYSNGTKMVLIRYRTADGLMDSVEVNTKNTLTPTKVFAPK